MVQLDRWTPDLSPLASSLTAAAEVEVCCTFMSMHAWIACTYFCLLACLLVMYTSRVIVSLGGPEALMATQWCGTTGSVAASQARGHKPVQILDIRKGRSPEYYCTYDTYIHTWVQQPSTPLLLHDLRQRQTAAWFTCPIGQFLVRVGEENNGRRPAVFCIESRNIWITYQDTWNISTHHDKTQGGLSQQDSDPIRDSTWPPTKVDTNRTWHNKVTLHKEDMCLLQHWQFCFLELNYSFYPCVNTWLYTHQSDQHLTHTPSHSVFVYLSIYVATYTYVCLVGNKLC